MPERNFLHLLKKYIETHVNDKKKTLHTHFGILLNVHSYLSRKIIPKEKPHLHKTTHVYMYINQKHC